MKKEILSLFFLVLIFTLITPVVFAHDFDRTTSDNPLRYVAYFCHPIGIAAEYLVLRPIHYLVSRPNVDILTGHVTHKNDVYFEWKQSGKPSKINVK